MRGAHPAPAAQTDSTIWGMRRATLAPELNEPGHPGQDRRAQATTKSRSLFLLSHTLHPTPDIPGLGASYLSLFRTDGWILLSSASFLCLTGYHS